MKSRCLSKCILVVRRYLIAQAWRLTFLQREKGRRNIFFSRLVTLISLLHSYDKASLQTPFSFQINRTSFQWRRRCQLTASFPYANHSQSTSIVPLFFLCQPEPLLEQFNCPICLNIMNDVWVTNCFHRFCENCIKGKFAAP
jgi:hypothetical protein